MNLSILVVTYNCKLEDSITIRSILNSGVYFSNTNLCIWNNGPHKIIIDNKLLDKLNAVGLNTTINQTICNLPLSWIYNHFIQTFPSNLHVFLDHDSNLTQEYLTSITKKDNLFIAIPIITNKGTPRSPCINGAYSAGPYSNKSLVIAIGSGVAISKEAAIIIKDKYGSIFDEHFALYGVDTSFFVRLSKMGLTGKLKIIPGFEHSMSRYETESKKTQLFRITERSYDLGLMLRHYPSARSIKMAAKQIFLWSIGKKNLHITKFFNAFFTGRHERCNLCRAMEKHMI